MGIQLMEPAECQSEIWPLVMGSLETWVLRTLFSAVLSTPALHWNGIVIVSFLWTRTWLANSDCGFELHLWMSLSWLADSVLAHLDMTFPCFQLQGREASVMLGWLCKVWKQLEFSLWRERKKQRRLELQPVRRGVVMGKTLDSSAPRLQKWRVKTIA